MEYNPYAAPTGASEGDDRQAGRDGSPQPWTVNDVVSTAWRLVKEQWPVLAIAPFVAYLAAAAPGQLPTLLEKMGLLSPFGTNRIVAELVGAVLGTVVGAFFAVGQTRILCSAARGGHPQFVELFFGASRFGAVLIQQLMFFSIIMIPTFGGGMLMGATSDPGTKVLIGVGLFVLLLVGAWLFTGLVFSTYFTVDAEMGPVEGMLASWVVTRGQRGRVFLLMLAMVGIGLTGMLACIVGVIPAYAVCMCSVAVAYTRASGRVGTTAATTGMILDPYMNVGSRGSE